MRPTNYLIILITTVFMFSCKKKEQKLKEDVNPIVLTFLKDRFKDGSTIVDSVRILNIDTLTEKLDSSDTYLRILFKRDSFREQIDVFNEETNSQLKMMRLSSGLSDALFQDAKDKATEANKKAGELLKTCDLLEKRASKISNLIKTNKLDSVTPKGYLVLFNMKGHKSNGEARDIDSGSLILDLDKRIVIKKEFEK